jgi:hypothetical protein
MELFYFTTCYGWIVTFLPNSYAEAVISNVTIFGDRICKVNNVKWGHKGETLIQ